MPSRFWMGVWRPVRRYHQIRRQRIVDIKVQGLDYVRRAIEHGHGVLITPNHPGHGDCYLLWEALSKLRQRCYVMTAWQVFHNAKLLDRLIYRHHGCFSVNREGNDLQAFRQAVHVLKNTSHPLVVFPEGDVYHLNDRVTPFREGTGAVVLSAMKHGRRPIECIPCALKYHYVQDPTPDLMRVMSELEQRLYWRPRTDMPLADRVYRIAEGILRLKELEYVETPGSGTLAERVINLGDEILRGLERRYDVSDAKETTPERVKDLRHLAIQQRGTLEPDAPQHEEIEKDLEDLFFVMQLFSYPGDYVAEQPTIERIAETVDKFEEDFLGVRTAGVRGARAATVVFGQPVTITEHGGRETARTLIHTLERRVQQLLDVPDESASRISA